MAEKLVLAKDYEDPRHWWQNPKFWASVAAVLLALSTIAGQYVAHNTLSEIREVKGTFNGLSEIAKTNSDALLALEKNQEGIDELVAFVHELQEDDGESDGGGQSGQVFVDLLCNTTDPATDNVCRQLEAEGVIVVNRPG